MEQTYDRMKETERRRDVLEPARADPGPRPGCGSRAQMLLTLQSNAGNLAVARLVRNRRAVPQSYGAGPPVIQRLKNIEQFNVVIKDIAEELEGSYLAKILNSIRKPSLDPENAEQNIAFRAAWKGDPKAEADEDTDRVMKENLIQSDWYGIGSALTARRLQNDKRAHLTPESEAAGSSVFTAFQNAMFFRAERKDSHGLARGRLDYDPTKHGPKGSAATMPGVRGEGVRRRSDKNLFVTRNRKELVEYLTKAVGGDREILNVVASQEEVAAMQYDVDSKGYKTTRPLTGIVTDHMTPEAKANLNTWLKGKEVDDDKTLNAVLKAFL